jgi:hypothetical protein
VLTITVPGRELFNEIDNEFVDTESFTLTLEHSLISLSKWEQFYEKPFLSNNEKSTEELIEYVKFMCVTRNVPDDVFKRLTEENIREIQAYIDAKMTATGFNEPPGAPRSRDVITSELIYFWMITFQIPFECEKWHLNRLFTLIRVCNNKQAKPKKMRRAEAISRQRELNEQRRAQLGTKG